MNKATLKTILETAKVGDTLQITFIPQHKTLSGEYTLLETKRGKGKSGSQICSVKNNLTKEVLSRFTTADKEKMFGTPVSEVILNIVHKGTMYGTEDEADIPNAYPRNEESAAQLVGVFDSLIGKFEGKKLQVTATEPEFAGVWTLVSGRIIPGRYGQRILLLRREDGTTRELWSYRHSGIIQNLNLILDDDDKV